MGNKDDESSIQQREKKKHGVIISQELAGLPKIWVNIGLPLLSEVLADSMWRAMGWVCERSNAVINTLKHVLRWRSNGTVETHASLWNERRPQQPHKVETQVDVAQSRVCLGTSGLARMTG